MSWNLDRWLAVTGVLLGLPGFLVLFYTREQGFAVLVAAVGVILLLSAWGVEYFTSLPPFSMKSVEVVLVFTSDDGKGAVLSKHYQVRPNFNNLREVVHRNIASDGTISGVEWNDEPVPSDCIRSILGEYEVTVRFPIPPQRWRVFPGKLSYRLADSFPGKTEGLMYVVDFPTPVVFFRIEFPLHRPCVSAQSYRLEGSGWVPIEQPVTRDDGRVVTMIVKRPRVGSEYAIYWRW